MSSKRVLVIIVNYASAELAVGAVESLQGEQRDAGMDVRIVVVENASGEAAYLGEKLGNKPGVSLVVADRNGGFAFGNNRGLDFAYESGFVPDYFHQVAKSPDIPAAS